MRTITTADRELLLEISPCDDDQVEIFTEADCWKLAFELQKRGVGELVAVADADDADMWCHMAVMLQDGTYLDANGLQTKSQLLARWGNFSNSGNGALARYGKVTQARWEELTADQFERTDAEDVAEAADMLTEWLEDL